MLISVFENIFLKIISEDIFLFKIYGPFTIVMINCKFKGKLSLQYKIMKALSTRAVLTNETKYFQYMLCFRFTDLYWNATKIETILTAF